jgi:hypothetical protein
MPRLTPIARLHVAIGLLVCVVLPGASYIDGSGRLAYGMFSETRQYALDVIAFGRDGSARAVSPTELAIAAGGTAATFLAGLDRFRRAPVILTPRQHLGDIGALACRVSGAAEVSVTLRERAKDDAPITATTERTRCPAP